MIKQTAGRDNLGDLAPKFAELNDDVLFGEVWSREDKLSLRDRSIVTVTALPVWWYTFAPAMSTYLQTADFKDKNTYIFATNGGWLGHTLKDYEKKVKNAQIKGELNIRFNGSKLVTSLSEIENWIKNIK